MMQRKNKKRPAGVFFLPLLFLALFSLVLPFAVGSRQDGAYVLAAENSPLRNTSVSGTSDGGKSDTPLMLSPGGMCFGVRLSTKGVLVVGFSRSASGGSSPAEEAGLHTKDIIEKINGRAVNTAAEVISYIEGCGGKTVTLTVNRDGKEKEIAFLPRLDADGLYKAGIWVRDSTAGIGTVTVVNPETGSFVGLGHGICDSDTGVLMPLLRGSVYDISVAAVRKGKAGAPGELKGYFSPSLTGILFSNTLAGVSGRFSQIDRTKLQSPMPVGKREEVHEGKASILCTLTNGIVTEYSVRIVKITDPDGEAKNFIIEVDDPRLLEETGGIVQGMSGSPVLQDGKIVGAVTHVMVNEPTRGYGIFIDNMLKIMP